MSQIARIIDKNLLEGIPSTEGAVSETVNLFGSEGKTKSFSCQFNSVALDPQQINFDSGTTSVDTFTFQAFVDTDSGDYLVISDTTGLKWAAAADLTGADPAPTGAVWVAIPSGRKVQVSLLGAITADDVATAFADALEALTAVPFSSVDSTDEVAVTQDLRGVIAAPQVHNINDSGAGSITVVVTTPGVNSDVNTTDDEITVAAHGFVEGLIVRVESDGTPPAPLMFTTNYFVIVVDANTVKLAETLEDAFEGIPIDLSDEGSNGALNNLSPEGLEGSVRLSKSNDGEHWIEVYSAGAGTGIVMVEEEDVSYQYIKVEKALTAGSFTLDALFQAIGSPL